MKTKLKKILQFLYVTLYICYTTNTKANTNNFHRAQNNENPITLNVNHAKLKDIFSLIEKQSAYTFVFDATLKEQNQLFSLHEKEISIQNLIQKLENQSNLNFQILNKTITVISIQQKEALIIKGKVVDENGLPLPGVSILQKGTQNAGLTNMDGNFEIKVTTTKAILTFSFIGYQTKNIPVNANFMTVKLQPEVNSLNEVVVTALGIKREEKKLGYSQATIDAENLSKTNPTNWSSGLKGKVAGMGIISSGSGPINSQQIILRGYSSFDLQQNSALIVIDGVPVNSEMTTSGSSTAYGGDDSPIDYGNGISDLNLDDIQEVTVLKGPNAAALYGSRGQNGVIMITTKSGKKNKDLGVSYNTSTNFDIIQRWPDYQYRYGQGTGKSFTSNGEPYYSYGSSSDGNSTGSTSSAWGPEFNEQYFYQYDPETQEQSATPQLWKAYKNNTKDFWRTGVTTQNSLSLQGGNDNGSMRLSLGHTKNEWIMPNTGFEKISASINSKYQVSKLLKIGTVINYTNRYSDNIPSTGYNNGSISYFMIFQNPNIDLNWYKPIWKEGRESIEQLNPFSSFIDNPYLIAYKALNSLESSQIVGNVFADLKFNKNTNLLLRTSINTYNQLREIKRPFDINRYAKGYYQKQLVFKEEINSDFLFTYNKSFKNDFEFNFNTGGNYRTEKRRQLTASVDGLVIPEVYKLANGISSPITLANDSNKIVSSLYGLTTFSFKDQVFMDFSLRNDWSSTLPKTNWSYFYPSANLSVIASDLFDFKSDTFSFLKYRFSYAKVGNDTDPYQTQKYYDNSSFSSSAVVDNNLFNTSLKPEVSNSYETGIEARFLKNKIKLDATLYRIITENQIITLPLNWSTGFSSKFTNAGKIRNQGIELSLQAKIFNSKSFKWNLAANWSKNQGKVFELPDEVDNQFTIDTGGSASMIAKVGGSPTAIYGYGFVRSPEGRIVYDNAGLPAYPATGDLKLIGDATPDWRAGINNEFQFGDFKFSFSFDGQYGGIIYSQTHHKLTEQGKLNHTLKGRETMSMVGDGVVLNSDGTYSENTTAVFTPDWYTRYYRRANVESNSFDASYIKLREIALQYSIPKKFLKKSFINNLDISIYGSNLFMITDFPIYDPETASLNGNKIMPGAEIGQMPSPANYGFNLKMNL